MAKAATGVREQIAFYGSTPAYRQVLDLHGWGDLQDELNRHVQGGPLEGDGRPDRRRDARGRSPWSPRSTRSAGALKARWGDVLDRISFYAPYEADPSQWDEVIADLKAA